MSSMLDNIRKLKVSKLKTIRFLIIRIILWMITNQTSKLKTSKFKDLKWLRRTRKMGGAVKVFKVNKILIWIRINHYKKLLNWRENLYQTVLTIPLLKHNKWSIPIWLFTSSNKCIKQIFNKIKTKTILKRIQETRKM